MSGPTGKAPATASFDGVADDAAGAPLKVGDALPLQPSAEWIVCLASGSALSSAAVIDGMLTPRQASRAAG